MIYSPPILKPVAGDKRMRFLRHLFRLLREIFEFAWHNKAWWIIPMVVVLLVIALLVFVGQSSAPAFIYTLF